MRLTESVQCTIDEVAALDLDLVVAGSGYETRSTFVPSHLARERIAQGVALGFADRKVLNRHENDHWFGTSGYEMLEAEGNSDSVIRALLSEALVRIDRPVRVLIDYTSMTRVWYAGALNALRDLTTRAPRVDVYFTYAPSKFSRPRKPMPNEHIGPVPGFSGLDLPDRRSALVIGLGYEQGRALGLAEYVEAAETFTFHADPALDPKFVEAVLRSNGPLLDRLGPERSFTYPLADLRSTAAKLGSLALGLSGQGYRVILAPLGPKPFSFLCFLLATQYKGLDVWRVSAGTSGKTYDRPPIGEVLVCRARFMNEAMLA
jgi:hypothetical protein